MVRQDCRSGGARSCPLRPPTPRPLPVAVDSQSSFTGYPETRGTFPGDGTPSVVLVGDPVVRGPPLPDGTGAVSSPSSPVLPGETRTPMCTVYKRTIKSGPSGSLTHLYVADDSYRPRVIYLFLRSAQVPDRGPLTVSEGTPTHLVNISQ